MRDNYDFSKGVHGKYAKRYKGRNVVILEPEVAPAFPDSESVNKVPKKLMEEENSSSEASGAR